MTLDTTTLRVAFSIVALILFVLFYFVTFRNTRSAYSAWWCAALGLFLCGSALYLFDGTFHQIWANPLGNALLVAGSVCVWTAARTLRTTRWKLWQLAAAPVLTIVVSAFDNPASNEWSGGPVFLLLMTVLIAMTSGELWSLERGYSRVHRPLAVAAGSLAVFYFGRWIAFLAVGADGQMFSAYFGSSVTTLATMVLLVAVSFSMASLSTEQLMRELKTCASEDGLTGLLNRTGFTDRAVEELRRMKTAGTQGTLILADLDHFKTINDTYGHAAGDSAIRAFASACKCTVRSTDVVGRYGGEEFVILLPGAEPRNAENIAIQISRILEAMNSPDGMKMPTVSYGVATLDPANTDLDTAIECADMALYRAKALGRDCVVRADIEDAAATPVGTGQQKGRKYA